MFRQALHIGLESLIQAFIALVKVVSARVISDTN